MDFTRSDVGHLLRRAGFGGADIGGGVPLRRCRRGTRWSTGCSTPPPSPPDTVPAKVDDRVDQWYPPWVAGVQYWMDRMATSPTPIVEKMALFWHGLFTSSVDKMYPRLVFKQIKTYRRLALGDLHELAQAMAIDPAMLLYLDNETNVAGRPNENFARELMELFLLGRANYAEADVAPMARAWTGHGYNSTTETYRWNATKHDGGAKTIFGITRNWDGPETITEMVRGSKQAVCARFIAGQGLGLPRRAGTRRRPPSTRWSPPSSARTWTSRRSCGRCSCTRSSGPRPPAPASCAARSSGWPRRCRRSA